MKMKNSLCASRNLKAGIGSLFDPCVNARRWPYWLSRMEASYCTFGFGAIIRRDLRTLSLPRDSLGDNLYACVIEVHAIKATHAKTKLFGRLNYEKIQRYNNSPPYVMARWLPQQIPPLNSLGAQSVLPIDIEYNKRLDRQRPCLEGGFNGGSNNIVQSNKSVWRRW